MSGIIKIFICYKKILSQEREGVIVQKENSSAEILHYILDRNDGYDAWLDESELATGMEWEKEIYQRLLASDVMLALVGPGTSESEWVKREIALATALGISVLPLGVDLPEPEFVEELKAMNLGHLQGRITQNIKLKRGDLLLGELEEDLEIAFRRTREKQKDILGGLLDSRRAQPPKAPDRQVVASFPVREVTVHLTSGDITKVRGVDVLVNSENDYMQMARFFESRTVSSILRRRGAQVQAGKYTDTIQQELDWQLRDWGRPVQAGEVFVTSAGGPDSELARVNRARFIFHVAAVQAVDSKATVVPYSEPQHIETFVRRCLVKLAKVNDDDGVVSPPGTPQRDEQEERAKAGQGPAGSILFPLFGTGQGGRAAADVIGPMLDGVEDFLENPGRVEVPPDLTEIYVQAFNQSDLETVEQALGRRYGEG